MNRKVLVCGSLAYDTIMVFQDKFGKHILPDQVHILNVAFTVPELRKEFGGCAGNIAYNLKLLGGEPVPMGTVGDDFGPYSSRFEELGISREQLKHVAGTYTAQAFITTDLDDNQITAFHPGAMSHSALCHAGEVADIGLAIIGPDSKEAMLQHGRELKARNVPFIFDPGQAMTLFDGEELKAMIELADWVAVNDYEANLLREKTGLSNQQIAGQVKALLITKGGEGSSIVSGEGEVEIPAVSVDHLADPTGCGDAYRAGLLYGLSHDMPLETCCRIASLAGAIKIRHPGTQNHFFTMDEFRSRYREAFGETF